MGFLWGVLLSDSAAELAIVDTAFKLHIFCIGMNRCDSIKCTLAYLKIAVPVFWFGTKASESMYWCITVMWDTDNTTRRKGSDVVLLSQLGGKW